MTVNRSLRPRWNTTVRSPRAWIDFAKGAAIILVVLYHSSLFLSEVGLAGSTPRLRAVLSFMPMAVFFFIAGLTAKRSVTWKFAELWRRRIAGLVYLYLLWSALRVLFYLIVPHLRESEPSPTDPLTIALLPVWPTSSLWFVWALALFAVVAWVLRRLPAQLQLALSGLLAVAFSTPGLLDTNNVGWDRVGQNLFFFLFALHLADGIHRSVTRTRGWHVAVLAVAYVVLAIALIPFHGAHIPGLAFVEGAVAIALTVAASKIIVELRWLSFVSALGRASLTIYLIHLFFIASIVALLAPIAPIVLPTRIANLVPFLLAALTLAVSLLLGKVLRRASWLWVNPFRSRPGRVIFPDRPSQAEPTQAEPSHAEPSQAEPTHAEPTRGQPQSGQTQKE